jgi:hypothetical protein
MMFEMLDGFEGSQARYATAELDISRTVVRSGIPDD